MISATEYLLAHQNRDIDEGSVASSAKGKVMYRKSLMNNLLSTAFLFDFTESEDYVVLVFTLRGELSSKRAFINQVDKMGRGVVKCP